MKAEIVTSRKKTILLLLGSLVFVAGGVFAPTVSYWADVFFAMCSIAFVAMLFRPYRLILENEGLTLSGGLRSPWKIRWRDVDRFFVSHPRLGVTVIRFNYGADASKKPRGTAFARTLTGADAALPGHWPQSDAAVVDMLNEYREQALANEKA
jgi:hypothetical protein|nr:hypothetical protein [Neorhizobium tomejilense]